MALSSGVTPAVLGVLVGVIAWLFAGRLIRGFLFETLATDWRAIAAVVVAMIAAALIASLLPALRAARVDPSILLRHL